jgi:peptide chain release factor subunit 1
MDPLLIEQFKIKRIIKYLESLKGNGTSMITLILPSGEQVSKVNQKLTDEMGAASNIKSRVNRLSVLSAISGAQIKLRTFNRTPPNGLVLFCGDSLLPNGKEKKITIAFEPYKAINTSLYMCDNRFHTESLYSLLHSEEKYGYLIIDGNGSLFATLNGNVKTIVQQFTVDLPKKHGRGGQSAVRFARLRKESYQNYIRKVSEIATNVFITNDVPNIHGLIIAGSANFKNMLVESDLFDGRLKSSIIKLFDVAYGGENGLNQAIQLSGETLQNVKFNKEKQYCTDFFTEIAKDTNKYVFGISEVMNALEMRSLEKLIVWEELPIIRVTTITDKIHYYSTVINGGSKPNTINEEIKEEIPLIDYITENYTLFNVELCLISNKSAEGMQFINGFSGLGGILRYAMNMEEFDNSYLEQTNEEDDNFW